MDATLTQQLTWLEQEAACLQGMRRGLEKEALRVQPDGWLAQTPHATGLGSALTNPYITTDYSEALIELITPACDTIDSALGWLDDLHRYVYPHIGDERLWVNSMPCKLGPDSNIPLAQYGSSNVGRMKTLYRHGLGVRYGRRMQTIAGIHYNVSFPQSFWQRWHEAAAETRDLQTFISEKYLGLVRNFQRQSWLLLYLLGASPAVCGTFLAGREHGLQEMPSGTLYLPEATSLRMSSLGYQNDAQSDLKVSYNALDKYIRDLDRAIHTPWPPYEAAGVVKDGIYQQINANILQIENEYYGLIRPKRVIQSGERPTQALARRGVEYVELRCVDLDPFEPLGISYDSAHFLEVFALHCLLSESALFTEEDYKRLPLNQQAMVERGRDPELQLQSSIGSRYFRDMAERLFAELVPVAAVLDEAHATNRYSAALNVQIAKLNDPELTGSAKVLRSLEAYGGCFFQFSQDHADQTREGFLARPLDVSRLQELSVIAQESLLAQQALEQTAQRPFPEYLASYFAD